MTGKIQRKLNYLGRKITIEASFVSHIHNHLSIQIRKSFLPVKMGVTKKALLTGCLHAAKQHMYTQNEFKGCNFQYSLS